MSIDTPIPIQSPRELVPYVGAAASPKVLVDERTEEELARACFKEMRRMQRRLDRLEQTTVKLEQTSGRAQQRLVEVLQGYPAVLQSANELRQGVDELSQEAAELHQRVEVLSHLEASLPSPVEAAPPALDESDVELLEEPAPHEKILQIAMPAMIMAGCFIAEICQVSRNRILLSLQQIAPCNLWDRFF